ncbi:MAG: hypothetical protein M1817_002311 [Caeruleum heppii]|nr:MAG: hypothetical protein M1817_003504 [Caeruleum heppii]KAI9673673.1 MAG: hypothetical protein M1817_002311 [Caeruleum heppii]
MTYHLVEPSPIHPSTPYAFHGRGGAGNIHRAPVSSGQNASSHSHPTSTASRTATTTSSKLSSHPPPTSFPTGRGGAGNFAHTSERAIFSFDEELEKQRLWDQHVAPIYHVGRGGAGNLVRDSNGSTREARRSGDSGRPSGAWERLSRTISSRS